MTILMLAFCLGVVAGLRTFTPIAAVLLARGGTWALVGIPVTLAAIFEFVMDVRPDTPSRTVPIAVAARMMSAAFAGWMIASMHDGSGLLGAIAGVAGAVLGTYGGLAARLAAISRIGAYPAAFVEDAIAIGIAAFVVTR